MSNDTIKRSDAIELCRKWRDKAHEAKDQDGWWMADNLLRHTKEIPSADAVSEWIPCSERLPQLTIHENEPFIGEWDDSEPVLIYHKDNKYEYPYLIAQYTNDFENGEVGWTEMEEATHVIDVIAWMPLPNPYEEVKENE